MAKKKHATRVTPEEREYQARVEASNRWTEKAKKAYDKGKPTPKRPRALEPPTLADLPQEQQPPDEDQTNPEWILRELQVWLDAMLTMGSVSRSDRYDWGRRARDAYRLLRNADLETPAALDDPPCGWTYDAEVAVLKAAVAALRPEQADEDEWLPEGGIPAEKFARLFNRRIRTLYRWAKEEKKVRQLPNGCWQYHRTFGPVRNLVSASRKR